MGSRKRSVLVGSERISQARAPARVDLKYESVRAAITEEQCRFGPKAIEQTTSGGAHATEELRAPTTRPRTRDPRASRGHGD